MKTRGVKTRGGIRIGGTNRKDRAHGTEKYQVDRVNVSVERGWLRPGKGCLMIG